MKLLWNVNTRPPDRKIPLSVGEEEVSLVSLCVSLSLQTDAKMGLCEKYLQFSAVLVFVALHCFATNVRDYCVIGAGPSGKIFMPNFNFTCLLPCPENQIQIHFRNQIHIQNIIAQYFVL